MTGGPEPTVPLGAVEPGTLVRDCERDQLAFVMCWQAGLVYLRAPRGGREWEQSPQHIRLATTQEQVSLRLALKNARSRGELL